MAKISFKEADNIFVNVRREYVKFSWINSFANMFGIIRLCQIHSVECGYQARERSHNTVQVNKFVLS